MAAVLLVLVVAAPAGAAPQWSDAREIAPPGATAPRGVMDARGNTLVTWLQRDGAAASSFYRWWQPASGWGEVRQVPVARGVGVVNAEITPHGAATVLLITGGCCAPNRLAVATAEPGGELGEFQTITDDAMGPSGPGSAYGVAVDDAGGAILAWRKWGDPNSSEPQPGFVATRAPGGRFGPSQQVGHFFNGPRAIAVNAAGAGAVAWGESATPNADGQGWTATGGISVTYRAPGGSFGPMEWTGLFGPSAHMGIDVTGRLVMTSATPYLNPGPESRARYAIRSPLGEWSGSRVLDAEGTVSDLLVEPRGAITFLVNRRPGGGYKDEARYVTLQPDGRLDDGPLSSGVSRWSPAGAINQRGDILAAWVRPHGEGDAADVVVRERAFAGGPFGEETVVGGTRYGEVENAVNDLGQALVVWADWPQPGTDGLVRAAVRDDPALRAVPAPPDVEIYSDPLATLDSDGDLLAPVSCSVSCKVRATGIVFPGGEARALAGAGPSQRLKARRKTKVKLDFGAEGRRAVKAALAAGQKPWVSVSVSARGKSPRPYAVSRRFKIRR